MSQSVATGLDRQSPHAALGGHGQVRVIADSGRSANFTIRGVVPDAVGDPPRIWVYPSRGVDAGGVSKLFAGAAPTPFGKARVLTPPPSAVTVQIGATPATQTAWAESEGAGFIERVKIGGNQLIVIAPHGGVIEAGTVEQIAVLEAHLAQLCPELGQPTVWSCEGKLCRDNYDRLHIASGDIDERSFPGLAQIWDTVARYRPKLRFRYALALHGTRRTDRSIVIGGRASVADKKLVRDAIAAKFTAAGETLNFCLLDATNTVVPAPGANFDCCWSTARGGTSVRNIVNRLSANNGNVSGHGAFQIEQSKDLRAPAAGSPPYNVWIAEGLAAAMCQLLLTPRSPSAARGSAEAPP
ncbi:poly-gamma-glutamate hydrolase family protein [Enhygromyxa salina]|uniref:poly-gamma-glutamate hydrolase family protein n=1 Tax=Enhygromyxa salina TaxID=215803 RepID=UPI0004E6774A|nr:poly-gamma-glutamate hydrolase family protein [Enhygromyxa salina]